MGVFDFLSDLFQFDATSKGRTKTWAVTFIPPLIFSLLFPFGFLAAIGYAASAAAIWACIVPALLARKSRLQVTSHNFEENEEGHKKSKPYQVPGGELVLVGVFIYGVVIIVINILVMFEALPVFEGV